MNNVFSVDVEDYYQVSAFENDINRSHWEKMESRVERNTHKVLEILNNNNVKGTFFVLGWIADRHPELVKSIDKEGHEIACHGYSHKLIYNQSVDEFRQETFQAKALLEDIIQKPVYGYRAASYSIIQESLWALDVLAEAGFKYDSSIYPVRHDRYGIPGTEELPYHVESPSGKTLVEFPLSVYKFFGYKLPVSGGGYFRLYPYNFTRYALSSLNRQHNPFVFYMHPWEIDPDQPRIRTNMLSRFRHYNNLQKCESRLQCLLNDFNFTTMRNVLVDQKLLDIVQ